MTADTSARPAMIHAFSGSSRIRQGQPTAGDHHIIRRADGYAEGARFYMKVFNDPKTRGMLDLDDHCRQERAQQTAQDHQDTRALQQQ